MVFTNALKNYSNNLVECKINCFDNLRALFNYYITTYSHYIQQFINN